MANIQGVVARKLEKPTRNGKVMYTIQVDGNYYGGMFDDPGCKEGDTVSFESSQNGNFNNVQKGTLQVVQNNNPAPQAQAGGNGQGGNRDEYWNSRAKADEARQVSIVYQSSRKDAIEVAKAMIENDLVSQPTKKGDKYDWFVGLVDVLTDRFHKDVADMGEYGQRTGQYDIVGDEEQGQDDGFGDS